MPGGVWGAVDAQRRAMAGTRDFLSRVRDRMRPRRCAEATPEERRKSGRHIRVGRKDRRHTLQRSSRRPLLRTFATVGLLYASFLWCAALCSALDSLTDHRHEWLGDTACFLWGTALNPYGLIPVFIPILFVICFFIALRSSFEKTPLPEVPDELRHTKLVTRTSGIESSPTPTQDRTNASAPTD